MAACRTHLSAAHATAHAAAHAAAAAAAPSAATSAAAAARAADLPLARPPLAPREAGLAAYTAACGAVPDDVLSRWAHAKLRGDPDALWALKKTLAVQLACASLLGHAMSVGQRQPHTFGVSMSSGRFVARNFHPCYRPGTAALDANEVYNKAS
jgi:hypothetical protein